MEQARDAGVGLPRERTPRPYTVVQNALQEACARYGISAVDLRVRFREELGNQLPGRNLFLDYCHLNERGIRVAMASAAETLLREFGAATPPGWATLATNAPKPSARTLSLANFLAAQQNWLCGQGRDNIAYYVQGALEADPGIRELLSDSIDVEIRTAQASICQSFERLYRAGGRPSAYYFSPLHTDRDKRSRLLLTEVILETLGQSGESLRTKVGELLKREHGALSHGTDLLQRFYWSHVERASIDPTGRRELAYFRSFRPSSSFVFVCERQAELDLTLTYRTPEEALPGEKLTVRVNGFSLTEPSPSLRWTLVRLRIPAERTQEGLNSLTIDWPLPATPWQDRVRRLSEQIEIGLAPPLYPIYGEIAQFRACAAQREIAPPARRGAATATSTPA
jgi:hypothetical protein